MSLTTRPPVATLIAENAPFTPEQREWLNGFFAGLLSLDGGITALSPAEAAALIPGALDGSLAPKSPLGDGDDGAAPWHDQTLPLGERMKLADGRPLRRRMMAAMGQQDCGQCGYNCQDYSDAIFLKKEERLNLCVPGGKETARMLKQLYEELDRAPPAAPASVPAAPAESAPAGPGRSRNHPIETTFLSRARLNKPGSQKETWHIEFDLRGTGLDYCVGDSFGLFPTNDPELVDAVIRTIDAPGDFPIGGRTLRDVLLDGVSLAPAPDMLFQLISYLTGGERRRKAQALARVALTVDAVRYAVGRRTRLGVASTFLAGRLAPRAKVKTYVQKAQGFGLPADPSTPIIMIGPGTGIAPFRAFLHERMATKAPGRNWLFFGHQHNKYDFFYEDELAGMKAAGVLTRLTLAWSRDSEQKIYVQHRMREVGRDLWAWVADGAHVYVCGDAKHMAKDVECALVDVVATCGARSTDQAIAFVADLKKAGRYQADVY